MTSERNGWLSANVDAAEWALARVRGGWGDDVPGYIRTAAAEDADLLEMIARYARQRMDGK